jgi:poly(beta-D-mannuronate) lyase
VKKLLGQVVVFGLGVGMCAGVAVGTLEAEPRLRSPWDALPVAVTDSPYTCPVLEPVSHDLTMDGFYRTDDPTHSIVDPVRMAAYTRAAEPVKEAGRQIVKAADTYRQTGSRAAAQCVVDRTLALAKADSFTGRMSSQQSYYVQGWIGGAIAIAYLKVEGSGLVKPQQTAVVAPWLMKVGAATRSFYDPRTAKGEAQNNHDYWAGVELAAIGILANDRADFDWGIHTYHVGVGMIRPDGTLPLEMERGARALHYHLYALAPLVMLAEFGAANGMDLYGVDGGALHRLVKVCVAGMADPTPFATATGVQQESEGVPSGDQIGWAPPYVKRFPNAALSRYIAAAPSLSVPYLGGLLPR